MTRKNLAIALAASISAFAILSGAAQAAPKYTSCFANYEASRGDKTIYISYYSSPFAFDYDGDDILDDDTRYGLVQEWGDFITSKYPDIDFYLIDCELQLSPDPASAEQYALQYQDKYVMQKEDWKPSHDLSGE